MKRMIFVIAFSVIASPLFAQNTIVNRYSGDSISAFDDFISLSTCFVPVIPSITLPPQVVAINPTGSYKVVWCVDKTGVDANGYTWALSVDNEGPFNLQFNCFAGGAPTACFALLPAGAITVLQIKSTHTIMIVGSAGGTNTNPLSFTVRRPTCITNNVTYEKGDPLPVVVTGALRNQQGSFTFETQVGKLRDDGWIIEWQRAQFGLDTNGLNGYWYMLGWCNGK